MIFFLPTCIQKPFLKKRIEAGNQRYTQIVPGVSLGNLCDSLGLSSQAPTEEEHAR